MSPPKYFTNLWKAVAGLEAKALDTWRNDHARGYSTTDALALHLQSIETTVDRRLAGNISVTVSMIAKRPPYHEVYYYQLQMTGKRAYILQEKAYR